MSKDFDDVIDPDLNLEALAEAQGKGIQEETTILELLAKNDYGNPIRVKVRYLPQSIASSLEFEDGTPIKKGERKPVFKFSKWAKNILPKMNALALKNIQIVNDLDGVEPGPRDIRISLIGEGEFKRLHALCFPGASDDSADSENEDNADGGKKRKGVRSKGTNDSSV
jgi:hypothetical protein